jgi:thioredoxin reductase
VLYDVIIVGGGPAGLSAALVLGRSCRRLLVCDDGHPRNAASRALHGFLSRDGIPPGELLRLGREELNRYGVDWRPDKIVSACQLAEQSRPGMAAFEVRLAGGETFQARKLLLATGLRDELPAIDGLLEFYGSSIHHCPYCDCHEHRGRRLAAYGAGTAAVGLALMLRTWSEHVTACGDGEPIDAKDQNRLSRNGIAWRGEKVIRLSGRDGRLAAVEFASGPSLACDALFFNTGSAQRSPLAPMLGCEIAGELVATHGKQRTGVPGLFLAGDADSDVQFAIVAAAEGARAAVAINRELQDEDRGEPDGE